MKKRWIVVLELHKLGDTLKLKKAKKIYNSMVGNASFSVPDPSMAEFADQITKTNLSYDASRDAGTEETDIFHIDMDDLERMMLSLADYVEIQANKHHDTGDVVIDSAGMRAKEVSVRNVQDFSVKNGKVQSTVIARAKALKGKVAYIWQLVAVDGGDFVQAAVTVKASYLFTNLDSGRTYKFRMAIVTKNGQGSWSIIITLVVL